MATIHPYKGYINTEFHIYAKGPEDVKYEVHPIHNGDDTYIVKGSATPNIPHSIKFKDPGTYKIVFSDGTSSEIIVEDGYKFGGSKPKAAFIYDECPWAFVVMHDRTYFYNRDSEESYVEAISPDTIEEISNDYVILWNNNHSERTIYSLNEQKPILNISNIVYTNDEVVIWKEDAELVLFSLVKRETISRISYIQYLIDKESRQLIFAYDQKIMQINLYGDFDLEELYHWKGKFLALINNSISVTCSYSDSLTHMQIINYISKEVIKEIELVGAIASVNNHEHIDVSSRKNTIRNFELDKTEFPEVSLDATYNDIMFYPCVWDIYYVVKTTTISKSTRHFKSEESITLHSINSDLEQELNRYDNKVIITDRRFVLYNSMESFVRSNLYSSAGYNKGGNVYEHNGIIIRECDKQISTLSRNGYWDNPRESNYNFSKFEKYGIIFDYEKKEYRSLRYNIKGKDLNYFSYPEDYIIVGGTVILASGKVFFNQSDFRTFSKRPLGISSSHQLGITIRDNKVFIVSFEGREEVFHEVLNDKFDTSDYKQVLLSEDSSKILYRNADKTEIKDITTGEISTFDNLSYVEQCNGIRPYFQSSSSLQPRIINPITGQVLDCELMKKFKFISPDGEYYAGTLKDMYSEQYFRENGEIIDNKEVEKLLESFSYPSKDKKNTQEWDEVTARRISFVEQHFEYINNEYPKLTHGQKDINKWDKILLDANDEHSALIFVRRVIAIRGIAIIRRMYDSSEVAKIDLGLPLSYINYVSFSYDSKYVSLAGYRDFSHGLFLIYDIENQKMVCREDTNRAVWTTSFSRNGDIAAYTSNPFTIFFDNELLNSEEYDFENHVICKRNFLTFSPKGNLIALSNQGYTSKYDEFGEPRDKWGHEPSTFVEVRSASDICNPIISFNDLSESGIAGCSDKHGDCPKSVASVAFSNDNKRLMMVGKDGVVIIRNLHLDDYAE